MKWFSPKERLPPEDLFVFVYVPSMPWLSKDSRGVFYDVASINIGMSEKDRMSLPEKDPRKKMYRSCDEFGNNLVPYNWTTFGPMSYFGQDVVAWRFIDYAEGF